MDTSVLETDHTMWKRITRCENGLPVVETDFSLWKWNIHCGNELLSVETDYLLGLLCFI